MPSPFSHTTRALTQDHAGPALLVWGLAGMALAAWFGWFFFGQVSVVEVSPQARLEVQQAAHAVNAPLAGRILRAAPPLGTVVLPGQVLVELDAGAANLRLREEATRRRGLLAQAAALGVEMAALERALGLDQQTARHAADGARFRTDEAGAALAHARDTARRLQTESEAGSVARVEASQAAAEARKLEAAREALAAEASRIGSDALTRSAQHRAQLDGLQRQRAALEGEAATAAALLDRLGLEIEQHLIRAPVGGRIGEAAPLHPGETIAAGQKLVTVVPEGELIAVADFEPAAVLGRVRPGQAAELRLAGFPWAQYGTVHATVSRVASEIRDNRIRVEFAPSAPWPAGIRPQHGLPGTIEVTLDAVAPAVMVLRAAGQLGGAAQR